MYPTGITGELGCLYLLGHFLYMHAEEYVWRPLAAIPWFGVPFYLLLGALSLLYIPGAPRMYFYMLEQRNYQLSNYGTEYRTSGGNKNR